MKILLLNSILLLSSFLTLGQETYYNQIFRSAVKLMDDNKVNGSGVFVRKNNSHYLITALHVIKNSSVLHLSYLGTNLERNYCQINLDSVEIRTNISKDLVAIRIGERIDENHVRISTQMHCNGLDVQMFPLDVNGFFKGDNQELLGRRILVPGYPTNVFNSYIDRTKPLLRNGIIAGLGTNESLIIDAPVYGGNSGGPIYVDIGDDTSTRFVFVGIAIQYSFGLNKIPTKDDSFDNSGLGVIITSKDIAQLISIEN